MFVLELTYTAPMDAVDAALEAHRAWLDEQYGKGVFLASGPKNPRDGGVILAVAEDRARIEEIRNMIEWGEPLDVLTPVQSALYADFREAYAAARRGNAPAKTEYWQALRDGALKGRMVADWREVSYREDPKINKLVRLPGLAEAYDAKLRAAGFFRTPTASTSISTISPSFMKTGGLRFAPTPPGVPVTITSPGLSGRNDEI